MIAHIAAWLRSSGSLGKVAQTFVLCKPLKMRNLSPKIALVRLHVILERTSAALHNVFSLSSLHHYDHSITKSLESLLIFIRYIWSRVLIFIANTWFMMITFKVSTPHDELVIDLSERAVVMLALVLQISPDCANFIFKFKGKSDCAT